MAWSLRDAIPVPRREALLRCWACVAYLGVVLAIVVTLLAAQERERVSCRDLEALKQPLRAALAYSVNLSQSTAHTRAQRTLAATRAEEARLMFNTYLRPDHC